MNLDDCDLFEWSDGLEAGGRRPRLYLVKAGQATKFTGQNIPGLVALAAVERMEAGKWSHTTYRLLLAPGVEPLCFLSPLHGHWGQHFTSLGEAAAHLRLPVEEARRIIAAEYPVTEARLDAVERFALATEAAGLEPEIVIVSFGSPTAGERRGGYWFQPKTGRASDGTEVTVEPATDANRNPDWYHPTVRSPLGATIISSRHTPGPAGGYWAVEVSVPVRE
jgi:hypothetical protein